MIYKTKPVTRMLVVDIFYGFTFYFLIDTKYLNRGKTSKTEMMVLSTEGG